MALLSGVGLALTIVFGFLLLALVAELYYLLWWKKQRITSCNSNNNTNSNDTGISLDYTNHTKEMFYLFCWDKPTQAPNPNPNPNPNPTPNPDLETGLGLGLGLGSPEKDESVEAELARLHNLVGPPRFLFTIKEESKEDLLFLSPMSSSPNNFSGRKDNYNHNSNSNSNSDSNSNSNYNYSNPLFESSVEAEVAMFMSSSSSPPPKFKFLRDAEEKLYRRLIEEAAQRRSEKGILDISHGVEEGSNKKDNNGVNLVKSCSSQVLPIDQITPLQSKQKQSLH